MNTLLLDEYRCVCGKLLLKGIFFDGTLEIKCKRCGKLNQIGNTKFKDSESSYILIIDENGNIVNMGSSVTNILGYTREELIGKHFTIINRTLPREFISRTTGSGSILNEDNYLQIDTTHQTKRGKRISVSVILKLFIPFPNEKYLIVSANLKNKRSDENEVKNNTPKFVDNACDFYFEVDKDGMVEYISPGVEKAFGFTSEKTIGKYYFDSLPLSVVTERKRTFTHFSALEQPFRVLEVIELQANGIEVSCDLYFTPTFNEVGKFTGYRVLGWTKKK